ncbi:type II secretion system F family protein [Jeotgalibacillus salarius]|uniref:Type II secretion system F family protein n=1 Tax=Jeotgalibacillus salarius TaxID=546023 RepID=A0A4Y8LE79_9BACL|nr:type II secretion system F family protein [Jeotgalibacillus salarius]TFE01017.1 type II secretion system F family protein [Jeotgalibacillus salarius]
MARFKYEGRTKSGLKKGIVSAVTRREAIQQLAGDGIRVTDIEEQQETLLNKDIAIGNPVKLQHLVIFVRQFSTLLKAGVTVVDATAILAQQTESKPLKKALLSVESELREGNTLSDALSKFNRIFEPFFVNMLRSGEASGNLDETLERLGDHYEKQYNTRQKIRSALSYPIVVGIVALGVVIFLLTSVVPTFVNMFADFGGELPLITQFVLNASDFMVDWWYIVILLIVGLFAGISTLKKHPKTKYQFDSFVLRIPLFGKLIQKAVLARLTRTLSSLFSSSVPILQALAIAETIVENEVVAKVIRESRDSLERGNSLTEPMKNHWAFPPLISQMIQIGEQTGSLDAMLGKVADFYEKEVDHATEQLKSLIEPLMIVFLAAVVGTIVTAIMVPMFEIFNDVQQY